MKHIFQYSSEEERDNILQTKSDLILIEEQNITEGNFLIFSDVPLDPPIIYINVPEVELNDLKNKLLTANEKYQALDKTNTALADLKAAKLAQLEESCDKSIVGGFDFTVNNVSYRFSCSVTAQANFQGTDTLFKDGLITEAEWTVVNNPTGAIERIILNQATFNQIKLQVFMHINSNVSKLRNTLQPQVDSALTNAEVDAVVW